MKENLHIKTLKTILIAFLMLTGLVCIVWIISNIAIAIGNIVASIESFKLRCLFLGVIAFIFLYMLVYCKLKEDLERAEWFKAIEEEHKNDKKWVFNKFIKKFNW